MSDVWLSGVEGFLTAKGFDSAQPDIILITKTVFVILN